MDDTELYCGSTYAIRSLDPQVHSVDLAVLKREFTEPSDGFTWVEIEASRGDDLIIEYYPKARFLDMIVSRPSVQTYSDRN